jgi:hypothetical protein
MDVERVAWTKEMRNARKVLVQKEKTKEKSLSVGWFCDKHVYQTVRKN